MNKKIRVTYMGETIDIDTLPSPGPVVIDDHFKSVRISPRAIDEASRVVPPETYRLKGIGLHTWLSRAADHVFKSLRVDEMEGKLGIMRYIFEFEHDGPVLKSVKLG